MDRRTVTIGAGLFAAVIVVFGIAVYLERGGSDGGPAPVTGPGRASEARSIIADIERRTGAADAALESPEVNLIERPAEAAGAGAGGADTAIREPAQEPVQAAPAGAELDAAFERALALQAAGQLDDAQVLLFFGARRGHARSAFAYAEINDPNHHSPETSLLAEPDAFQAFRWYSTALDAGMDSASERLAALHEWAEAAAAAGDSEAERLLLQWE
jgi:TPR repeat protein